MALLLNRDLKVTTTQKSVHNYFRLQKHEWSKTGAVLWWVWFVCRDSLYIFNMDLIWLVGWVGLRVSGRRISWVIFGVSGRNILCVVGCKEHNEVTMVSLRWRYRARSSSSRKAYFGNAAGCLRLQRRWQSLLKDNDWLDFTSRQLN